ncbi:FxsA family protein [Dongia sp.]|uniref:FxsA family protein n=1 Tax=Dongia sp. TaxID=1977262 RepID=UPI0035ADF02C
MMRLLVALICLLPFLEIAGFVVIGGRIGLGLTLLWLLAAGMLGLALIRHGGLNALLKLQVAVNEGREPGHSLIDGAVMVTAGLLLIVPGFFSDFLALILLLPVTRNFLLRRMAHHFETRIYRGGGGTAGASRTTVIEGEFEIVEPEEEEAARPRHRPTPTVIDQRPDKS